jgi:hypothetical protein
MSSYERKNASPKMHNMAGCGKFVHGKESQGSKWTKNFDQAEMKPKCITVTKEMYGMMAESGIDMSSVAIAPKGFMDGMLTFRETYTSTDASGTKVTIERSFNKAAAEKGFTQTKKVEKKVCACSAFTEKKVPKHEEWTHVTRDLPEWRKHGRC